MDAHDTARTRRDGARGKVRAFVGGVAVAIGVLLLVPIGVTLYQRLVRPSMNVAPTLTLVSIVVNAILTVGLLYVYAQIAVLEDVQTELQRTQTRVIRLQSEPLLLHEDWRFENGRFETVVSNVGDGVAKDLGVRAFLWPLTDADIPAEGYVTFGRESLYRQQNYEGTDVDADRFNRISGGVLPTDDLAVPFAREVLNPVADATAFDRGTWTDFPPSFTGQQAYLRELGYSHALVQIVLEYENAIDDTFHTALGTVIAPLDDSVDVEAAFTEEGTELPGIDAFPRSDREESTALSERSFDPEAYL